MFAVVKSGGKQYKVSEGDVLRLERIEAKEGKELILSEVLLVGDGESVTVGSPLLEGYSVVTHVIAQTRAPKIIVFKKKRRQNYRRKRGHRQHITIVRVTGFQRP